jgi:protein O-mannosyl-transferase
MKSQSFSSRSFVKQLIPDFLCLTLVVGCTVFAFWPALDNGFVNWDDDKLLLKNPHFRGLGAGQLRWMFTTCLMGHYEPLTWLTYGLDFEIWGLAPQGYHLTNLVWHVVNGVLFFVLAQSLLELAGFGAKAICRVAAAAAAIAFAAHPLRAESVAWVSERRDVLSAFFCLTTVLCYVRYAIASDEARQKGVWYFGSLLSYAASLLCKATAVGLPITLLMLDWYPLRRTDLRRTSFRKLAYEKIPFAVLALGAAVVALYAQRQVDTLASMSAHGLASRLLCFAYGLSFYITRTLVPLGLSPLVPMPPRLSAAQITAALTAVGLLTFLIVIGIRRTRWRAASAIAVNYILFLLPVAGLAQIGPQLVADRYSYLSCMGIALMAGVLASSLWVMGHARGTIWSLVLIGAGAIVAGEMCHLTRMQVAVWRDSIRLWSRVVRLFPNSAIAHSNLASAEGEVGNLAQATRHFRWALQLNSAMLEARYGLGIVALQQGDLKEALASFQHVVALSPDHGDAWNNLGGILLQTGEQAAAIDALKRAVALQPESAGALYNLGLAHNAMGRVDEAVYCWRQAAMHAPDSLPIVMTLAWHLATVSDGTIRDGAEACRLAKRAVHLGSADDATPLKILAAARAEVGRFDDAVQAAEQALQLARASGDSQLSGEIELQLNRYRVHQPIRER